MDDPGYLRAVTLDEYDDERRLDDEQPRRRGLDRRRRPAGPAARPAQSGRPVTRDDPGRSSTTTASCRCRSPRWRCGCTTRRATTGASTPTTGHRLRPRRHQRRAELHRRPPTEPRPSAPSAGRGPSSCRRTTRCSSASPPCPPLDPRVTDLRRRGDRRGAAPPYERVRRIHAYLTDRANGFRYSLVHRAGHQRRRPGRLPPPAPRLLRAVRRGDGGHGPGGRGAGAAWPWATRRATVQRDGSRLITSDDAHAWVEVYFDDLGWVPFDPTPIAARPRRSTCPGRRGPDADDRRRQRPGRPRPPAPTQPGADAADGPRPASGVPRRQPAARATTASLRPLLAGAGRRAAGRRRRRGARPASAVLQRRRRVADRHRRRAVGRADRHGARTSGVRLNPAWTPRQAAGELAGVCGRGRRRRGRRGADAVRRLARAEEAASYGRARAPARGVAPRPRARRCGPPAGACWRAASATRPAAGPAVAGVPGGRRRRRGWPTRPAAAAALGRRAGAAAARRPHRARSDAPGRATAAVPEDGGCREARWRLLVVAAAEALLEAVLQRLPADACRRGRRGPGRPGRGRRPGCCRPRRRRWRPCS